MPEEREIVAARVSLGQKEFFSGGVALLFLFLLDMQKEATPWAKTVNVQAASLPSCHG